jgi:hypothetical protein
VNLIQKCGQIGLAVLVQMDVGFSVLVPDPAPDRHSRGRAMRAQIAQDFRERQAQFGSLDDLADEEEDLRALCSVCNRPAASDDLLCYPAVIFGIPSLRPETRLSLRICPHVVHETCVTRSESGDFRCPVDRLHRSVLIPDVDKIGFNVPSETERKRIFNFKSALSLRSEFFQSFDALVSSFVVTIYSFDARLKFEDGAPDGRNERTLLRNLFLLLWHFHHTLKCSCADAAGDPFHVLVLAAISADDPPAEFLRAVHSIFLRAKKHEAEFLRLAAIFRRMALATSFESTNWGEILDPAALVQSFQVVLTARRQVFSPQISLIGLPASFLDFARPPFNFAIDNHSHQLGLCLSTGKIVSMERSGMSYPSLANHMDSEANLSVSYVVALTGPCASAFYLVVRQANTIRTIPTIYLDAHGDEDIGFARGQLLFLSTERLAKYEIMLLSGEWTDFDSSA